MKVLVVVAAIFACVIVGNVYHDDIFPFVERFVALARKYFHNCGLDVSYNRREITINYSEYGLRPLGSSLKSLHHVLRKNGKAKANKHQASLNAMGGHKRQTIVPSMVVGKNSTLGFEAKLNCSRSFTGVEDILCMKRPDFHPSFQNPCWYQNGNLRCLPYFHIIGVCKTGTSDLFRRLSQHPEVLSNYGIMGKETWYWTWRRYGKAWFGRSNVPKMTLDKFINSFDARGIEETFMEDQEGNSFHPMITGHGDPMDFWDQTSWRKIPQNDVNKLSPDVTTASLIKHVNPNVKLILMLREPVERLYSHYLHARYGSTAEQFHNDVMTSLPILESCTTTLPLRTCLYSQDLMKKMKVPLSASFYSLHLKEWLNVFPREQILIMRTEDFAANVTEGLRKVFTFLRVASLSDRDVTQIAQLPTFHKTKAKTTAGSIKPETRAALEKIFNPYNQDLANLLKDNIYLWNSKPSLKRDTT